ncbi:MAG: hypothetical protein Q9M36_08395 [Sulfurovum sp.]|nr:hypothetical protein [Sulfurovum sp.]
MIKICVDDSIINEFYDGVKKYIGKGLFTSVETRYFTDKKIEEIIKCKPNDFEEKLIKEITSQIH